MFSLSSDNVIQYLRQAGLSSLEDGASASEELPHSNKNLNLLVTFADNSKLLVKQQPYQENYGLQEFFNEWLFHQLLQQFPVLSNISTLSSSLLHFDEENSILVRNYLKEYLELFSFYKQNLKFPREIACALGTTLGVLHRATFNHSEYRQFMATPPSGQFRYQFYNPAQGIESITAEIFSLVPTQALKFYAIYQRYENLEAAIAELASEWLPCCITHNDLKLDNILLHSRWQQLDDCLVQLIDWEACGWGDPAFDLGTLLASYLEIWLNSVVIDPTIELEESLNLAVIPLEDIQPSIVTLTQTYLNTFPRILEYRTDFLQRVIQFAGLALIHNIEERIKCHKYFASHSVLILDIAKNLLTMPSESILTIFGISESEIIKPVAKSEKVLQTESKDNLVRLYYNKTRLRGC